MTTALMHWIWQGIALVAVVSLCLARARQVSASMRYRVWWATLALVMALPVLATLEFPGLGALLGNAAIAGPSNLPNSGTSPPPIDPISGWPEWLPLLAFGGWVLWSAYRFRSALAHLDTAKRACRPFPIARERALPRWKAARNRGRRATLVVSEQVRAAAVLGLGYPRIAVAPHLVRSLTDDELDQLVLHEYAHVQRRDDQASAVHLIAKALVGWHPAVWWIDRRLRIEREVACDDWVLATTGEARTYARCLARVAGLAVGADSSLMPAATRQRQLTMRVMRLLDGRRNTSTRPSFALLAAAALLLAVLSAGIAGNHTNVIALPAVVRAGLAPAVETPELTRAKLIQRLAEPSTPGARPAQDSDATAARGSDAPLPHVALVRAAVLPPSDVEQSAVAASVASIDEPTAPASVVAAAVARAPNDVTLEPPTADASTPVARTGDPAELTSSDSWVASTRRALADAGKATGQSLAEAGMNAGLAVADAGVAAARGTQKGAAKAGRFFSRLGRKLARPF